MWFNYVFSFGPPLMWADVLSATEVNQQYTFQHWIRSKVDNWVWNHGTPDYYEVISTLNYSSAVFVSNRFDLATGDWSLRTWSNVNITGLPGNKIPCWIFCCHRHVESKMILIASAHFSRVLPKWKSALTESLSHGSWITISHFCGCFFLSEKLTQFHLGTAMRAQLHIQKFIH